MKRLALILLVASTVAFPRQRYVTVTGAGSHDGSSTGNAWSMTEGNTNHIGGDTVNVSAGTYTTGIFPVSGTSGSWTIWRPAAGASPIIQNTALAIGIIGKDYCGVIGNDTVKGSGFQLLNNQNGFKVYGSGSTFPNYWTIRNLYIDIAGTNSWYNSAVSSYEPSNTPSAWYNVQYTTHGEIGYIYFDNTDIAAQQVSGVPEEIIYCQQNDHLWVHDVVFCPVYHGTCQPTNCTWYVQQRTSQWGPTHGYFGASDNTVNALFEDCFMRDGGQWPATASGGANMEVIHSSKNIYRFNRMVADTIDNDGSAYNWNMIGSWEPTDVEYIGMYHNVWWSHPTRMASIRGGFGIARDAGATNIRYNRIYNNVIEGSGASSNATVGLYIGSPSTTSPPWAVFDGNCIRRPWETSKEVYFTDAGNMTLANAKANYPAYFLSGNFNTDPAFADTTKAGGYGFAIGATSPLVDVGVPLATVTSPSSNTLVNVDAAYMFWPGDGYWTVGDYIKIGSTAVVQVTGRDVESGTITIASDRTVTAGMGIYLYRNGAVVNDVGTYQYSGVPPPLTPDAPVATGPSGMSRTTATLNWNSVADVSSYQLDVAYDGAFSSYLSGYENKSVQSTSESLTGLPLGTQLFYRVRAINGNGTSGNSNVVPVKTFRNLRGHR